MTSIKPETSLTSGVIAGRTAVKHQSAWFSHVLLVNSSDTSREETESALTAIAESGVFVFVDVALSGKDALALASETAYDLVIIDADLSDGSALATCRALKRLEFAPHVLMLDTKPTPVTLSKGRLAGCDNYLSKQSQETDIRALLRLITLKKQTALL